MVEEQKASGGGEKAAIENGLEVAEACCVNARGVHCAFGEGVGSERNGDSGGVDKDEVNTSTPIMVLIGENNILYSGFESVIRCYLLTKKIR